MFLKSGWFYIMSIWIKYFFFFFYLHSKTTKNVYIVQIKTWQFSCSLHFLPLFSTLFRYSRTRWDFLTPGDWLPQGDGQPRRPRPFVLSRSARRFSLFTRCLRDFGGARETAQMATIAFSATWALLLWISHTASSARVYPPNEGKDHGNLTGILF